MPFSNIDKPNSYFNTVLFTGNSTARSITGVNFSPDLVWIKARSTTSNHFLMDSVRGGNKTLLTDATDAEYTGTYVTSFDSDGFSIGSTSINVSPYTYVSWSWRGSDSSAVSNTSGSITSTVSASQTSGFSIVSYTGNGTANATVGHGLGVTPKMIITRNRNNTTATNWTVYHVSLSTNNQITLNQTDAQNLPSPLMVTTVGSSTYTLGSSRREINQSSDTYIAYCFAEVKGFSKFGSYTGNNTNDGPFVYTGFKPAFILLKPSNGAYNWTIIDNKRNTYNVTTLGLIPNTTSADTTGAGSTYNMDILSNGFKPRYSSVELNGSLTYIYMAFAENPFVSSKGIPTTAR